VIVNKGISNKSKPTVPMTLFAPQIPPIQTVIRTLIEESPRHSVMSDWDYVT
jgi:hypothetical protein